MLWYSKGGTFAPPEPVKTKKEVCDEDNYFFFLVNNPKSHSIRPQSHNPFDANPAPNPHKSACHQSRPSNIPRLNPQANIPSPMPITQEMIRCTHSEGSTLKSFLTNSVTTAVTPTTPAKVAKFAA